MRCCSGIAGEGTVWHPPSSAGQCGVPRGRGAALDHGLSACTQALCCVTVLGPLHSVQPARAE